MAAHSNRSPSPISSRPLNPNPRNSESNSSIRRSFSGSSHYSKPSILTNSRRLDPITPANSPSDFLRRRSVDREEKENDEKDSFLRTSMLQSPAKGCKNFMAPTISAASKFTPSPRKKVLVERNDPVRTSISLSDGKAMFFSDMPNLGDDLEKKPGSNLADLESKKAVSKPPKKVTFLDIPSDSSESVVTDCDGLKLESDSIAMLDVDPSLPPYDPKTNYLSPRPQFIRYKPNPRVVMMLNKEKSLEPDDSLMGDIMAEGLSDSDEGGDEFQNQEMESTGVVIGDSDEGFVESQNQEMEPDMVIGVDEEIVAESVLSDPVSDPLPVSTTPSDEEGVVLSNEMKPRSWSRLMCFSVILTLLIAGSVSIYVTNSPSFYEFLVQDLGFSDLGNLYQQSREAVGLLARQVHHVSVNSVAMVFKLVSEMGEGEKRVPLQFMNLSDLQEITLNKGNFQHIVENLEVDEFEEEMDSEMVEEEEGLHAVLDTLEEEAYEEAVELESEYLQDLHNQEELNSADQPAAEVAELESENLQDFKNQEEQKHQEAANEVELERLEAEKPQIDTNLDTTRPESTPVEEGIFGIASIFAGLLAFAAAAAFIYHYKRNHHHHHQPNESKVEQVLAKQKDSNAHQEKELSQSWQAESYCPSEMSGSFQTESKSMREVQSSERKARKYSRRESLASSSRFSIESPSYGSFTTYEKIPIKSSVSVEGYGDEEIITPVRRSSRIRNHQQVTSP